jgi:DNA processing protein
MISENAGELFYRMALALVEGVGPQTSKTLIAHCGSAENIFKEKERLLWKIPDVGKVRARAVKSFKLFDRVEKELEFIEKNHVDVFSFTNDHFPYRLKQCPDSPLVIFKKGNINLNHKRVVAIVGTRYATGYGKQITKEIIEGLKALDVIVISGLAYGTDINAHRDSLRENIPTAAVFAHGFDTIYPGVHDGTAHEMLDNGGWVTDFMSGTIPERENFPKRNRIIAGLSDAVIIVEAAARGGALITAEYANSYNRDVFAVPGNLKNTFSVGCNNLIKTHKAALLQSADDVKYIMRWDDQQKSEMVQKNLFIPSSPDEEKVYEYLRSNGKTGIEELAVKNLISQGLLAAILTTMEMDGIVKAFPGKAYELV